MRKTLFLSCVAVLALTGLAAADPAAPPSQPNAAAGASDQAQQIPAEKFIQDLGDKAIAIVKDKSLNATQRSQKYRDVLNTAFDMPTIAKFVLGRAWNAATPQQQQDFTNTLEALVVQTYGDRLNFYNGENLQVKSFRPESDKDVIVNSVITHPRGAPPTAIDWRVRQTNGKLAILDVVVEGVSQSVTQRQEYASILERNNNNMDALIAMMRQRLQQSNDAPTTTTQ